MGHQFAFGGRGAVDLLDDFVELDPTVLGGGFVGGNGHDERNETIGTGAGNGCVVDEGLAKGNGFRDVRFVVSGEEKVKRHIGISGVILLVDLGRVGVDVVGLDHTLGSQDFGTLIVSKRGLTADIDHGLDASGVSDDAGCGVVFFGTFVVLDFHIDVGRTNSKDINGVGTGQESCHIQIVDGHVGEDATATLDVRRWWSRRITGAQFDLHTHRGTNAKRRAISEQGTSHSKSWTKQKCTMPIISVIQKCNAKPNKTKHQRNTKRKLKPKPTMMGSPTSLDSTACLTRLKF